MLPLFLLFVLTVCVTQAANVNIKQLHTKFPSKKPWELNEALSVASSIRGFNGTWITDNELYYTNVDKSIHKYDAATQEDIIFVTSKFLETYRGATFTLSPDNTKILVRYDIEMVFRHSYTAKYDIYDIATGTVIHIHKGKKLQYCIWSPIKDRLAYVYENDVYIHFEEHLEIAITSDGTVGKIYNGVPDWVYEEEVLSSGSALWWSPDGLKLAVGLFNDTNVETYKYFIYGEPENIDYQYPKEIDLKYPKPGTPNPTVAIRVFQLSGGNEPAVTRVEAPSQIVSDDHILKSVTWASNDNLLITWLNRRQNIATIQSCSLAGLCKEVTRLEEPEGWVSIDKPQCLASGQNCLFTYWIDGWMQVWNLDLASGKNIWKSRGNFTVLKIYGYNEANDKLYYQATLKNNPSQYHVFSNNDCLTCNLTDVDNAPCTSAAASFSKNYSYFAVICTGPNPSYTRIVKSETNTAVSDWELNREFRRKLESKLRGTNKYMNVTLADGSTGLAKLVLPPDFVESKKYALIVNVYGGPDSMQVKNDFNVGFEGFVTTKRDTIYAYIDGRGTGNKGKKLLFSVNNDLGDHEVEDQLFVTKWLQENLTYVDRDRTGIWGWSYGGYMAAKTIAADDERIFQCGISVAPVTSWLYYDTIYTERYMGLPIKSDNLVKYQTSSVLNVKNLDNFRHHDYLLIHGSGDDNVHYQNSLLFAKLLQENDIQFEEQTYTDENHSIGHFLPHLYKLIDNFWINCLNLDVGEDGI